MLLTIISAIIALSVLIIVHEFGHFIIAKRTGIRVDEFSLGLGPKIVGIKKGDTTYRLSLVPFGGYVKLAGMEPKEIKGEKNEFASKSVRVKIGVVSAGPIFNLILAFVIFTLSSFIFGIHELPTRIVKSAKCPQLEPLDEIISINDIEVKTWNDIIKGIYEKDSAQCLIKRKEEKINITLHPTDEGFGLEPLILPITGKVKRGRPAWKAGIRENDLITKINNKEIQSWTNLTSIIQKNLGKEVSIGWLRDGNYMSAKVIPEKGQIPTEDNKLKDVGMIGIQMKTVRKPIEIGTFKEGFLRTTGTIVLTFSFLKKLITREVSSKALGGPLSIVRFAGWSARRGIEIFISFVAFISIQLFILNLIPFPPLDGGQILLIIIEKIRKKPISEKTINLIQNIGFACLMLLILYVTMNDILRIIK
ncbi:RIP metalloprotease RseP [candidate division WOR-3 bacterium]|nr:RIP metalloprotease RseP [candidate division WOR-3 bacterium]